MPPATVKGPERQASLFLQGLAGVKPKIHFAYEELEKQAQEILPEDAFGYVVGGAGGNATTRANRAAFDKWRIVPRHLRDVEERTCQTTVLGQTMPFPIMIAPVGVMELMHADAEVAVAKAARSVGLPMILSTVSSKPMEEVAEALGPTPRWFQLYWPNEPSIMASFVERAEEAEYSAIVVTIDTTLFAWRERDLQNAFLPFLLGKGIANYTSDPVFQASTITNLPLVKYPAAIQKFAAIFKNPGLSWNDLAQLRRRTTLPILLKGILHPDDARMALNHGVNGIIVSNHGGRQVDGSIATLDALPNIVEAVEGAIPVLFDSGIRRGADIFKAIALGAKAVLVGRPYVYGLAVDGEQGVRDVLTNLMADFDLCMGLSGCHSISEINRGCLVRECL